MRSAKNFGNIVNNWALLNDNLKPRVEELGPQAQTLQVELDGVLGRARALENRQEQARAEFHQLTRDRQELEKEGEVLRRRLSSFVRGTYGFTSEQLIPFGIQPRPRNSAPRRTRKKKEEEQEQASTPPPAAAAQS